MVTPAVTALVAMLAGVLQNGQSSSSSAVALTCTPLVQHSSQMSETSSSPLDASQLCVFGFAQQPPNFAIGQLEFECELQESLLR
jgi:hypothetical protein